MDTTATLFMPIGISDRQRRTYATFVERQGDCFIWVGGKTRKGWRGYAIYKLKDSPAFVLHRRLWLDHRGPLTADQQLDHLCRNRACINLDHLEPVSLHENNVIRGTGLAAQNYLKTECPQGHPYDDVNTFVDKTGRRHCRECSRQQVRKRRAEHRYTPSEVRKTARRVRNKPV